MTIANPNFVAFQNSYFKVYFPALMAEWLQGPYLYKLYSHYGFIDTQIAIIYVCGFASSVVFGTSAGYFASAFGRKKACVVFTLLYSLCCITKLSRNYAILIFGRVLGGISTSLLFTAFGAWYLYGKHTQTHSFPSEWVTATFCQSKTLHHLCSGGDSGKYCSRMDEIWSCCTVCSGDTICYNCWNLNSALMG